MNRWLSLVLVFVAALAATPASAQETKTTTDVVVVLEAGKPKGRNGLVSSADYDKVVLTGEGGKRVEVPAGDVVEIRWGDAPSGYVDGMRALAGRDPEGARRAFQDALDEKGAKPDLREWINEFANAGKGRALLDLGQADGAAQAFGAARNSNPKSLILDRILLGLAEAELARGKGDAAAKAADDLIAAAKAARRPAWESDAYLVRAKAKLAAGDYAGAAAAYDDLIRFAENAMASERTDAGKKHLQALVLDAGVAKGWALVTKADSTKAASDYDAARSYFDGLAAKYPSEATVAAAASNAAGVAKLASGDVKGALRQFISTEVVRFRARDEVARALWYQAECWKKLGDEQRRADRIKELTESFPGSEWARRAQ